MSNNSHVQRNYMDADKRNARDRERSRSPSRKHRRRSRSRSRSRDRSSRHHSTYSRSRTHRNSRSRSRTPKESRKHKRRSRSRTPEKNTKNDSKLQRHYSPQPSSSKKYDDKNHKYVHLNDNDEPLDKERIHKEMEEKLRETLAREGKVYPPKKQEASHPVFANDGSFLEIFKKMQEQQQQQKVVTNASSLPIPILPQSVNPAVAYVAATALGKTTPPPPPPLVGRRRGGKILKTGLVAKQKGIGEQGNADPKDFWSLYLAEVNKYKNTACETEPGTRPLVK